MTKRHSLLTRPVLLALLAVSGCATPPADHPYGHRIALTMAQQVLDPLAGTKHDAVNGMGGQEAKSAYDAYQKSFRAPQPQPNVFTIGVGGAR
ncbi:pilus assembly protein [Massilia litorea]|uniref:Pilus assembly protein n=1 Tax=Massilia litorea TaxID=2769491 RepID=A0A7L9UBF6_9BURK|nr:pilus assembly protein [Massilia litorea]QOL51769.1 pilus assembly protein [Massilia litorea]